MAEFIFKDMCKGREVLIESAATSTEEIIGGVGNPVYPPAKRELAAHGLSCEGKRARQITKDDFNNFDYLICMDSANLRNTLRMQGNGGGGRVMKLSDFGGISGDVSDPWYTGDFKTAYDDIYCGCRALYKYLCENERGRF